LSGPRLPQGTARLRPSEQNPGNIFEKCKMPERWKPCRKHSPNGMQSETSGQRAISIGQSAEPNSQPKVTIRRRFGRDSFPTRCLSNAMDGDQHWRGPQFLPPSITRSVITEPLEQMNNRSLPQKRIVQDLAFRWEKSSIRSVTPKVLPFLSTHSQRDKPASPRLRCTSPAGHKTMEKM
jgi:hypothetical protein